MKLKDNVNLKAIHNLISLYLSTWQYLMLKDDIAMVTTY